MFGSVACKISFGGLFSWINVAVLASALILLFGLWLLSDWKQNTNTFLGAIGIILAVVVIDITVLPFLTPETGPLVLLANAAAFIVMTVGVLLFWNRRIPKFSLDEAQAYVIEYLKTKYESPQIDRTRRGYLEGRLYHIFVLYVYAGMLRSHEVVLDAANKKVVSDK